MVGLSIAFSYLLCPGVVVQMAGERLVGQGSLSAVEHGLSERDGKQDLGYLGTEITYQVARVDDVDGGCVHQRLNKIPLGRSDHVSGESKQFKFKQSLLQIWETGK